MPSRQGDIQKQLYYTNENTINHSLHNKKSKTVAGRFDDNHRVIHSAIVQQQHVKKVFWWKLNDIILVEPIVMSI